MGFRDGKNSCNVTNLMSKANFKCQELSESKFFSSSFKSWIYCVKKGENPPMCSVERKRNLTHRWIFAELTWTLPPKRPLRLRSQRLPPLHIEYFPIKQYIKCGLWPWDQDQNLKKKCYQKLRRKTPMHLNKLSSVAPLLWKLRTFFLKVKVNKFTFLYKKEVPKT